VSEILKWLKVYYRETKHYKNSSREKERDTKIKTKII
jgi:hypothetical protein